AIVNRLLSDGFEVFVHYNSTNIETLQSDYIGKPVEFLQCDLNQDIDLESYFSWITKLDCLVYASGTALYGQLQDVTDKEIDDC
ncbi:3-oxoacyl-ACP reductase, partial [Staphylococcus aureus]|nr:3-oxoacyl-ACP reductase [Staphylococcus aureus]